MRNFNNEEIVARLTTKGYDATLQEVNKNGLIKSAVTIKEEGSNVAPTIYLDGLQAETVEEATEEIIKIYTSLDKPKFDIEPLKAFETVRENLRVCICGKGKAGSPAAEVLDMEMYARVLIGDNGSCKVTESLLENWGKSIEEVIAEGINNTFKEAQAITMSDFIKGLTNEDFSDMSPVPMVIIGNENKYLGAIQMCNLDLLEKVANNLDSDLYILPSSIHECIAVPASGDVITFSEMVKEVNAAQVAPEEQLTDSVYFFSRKEKRLTLAQ